MRNSKKKSTTKSEDIPIKKSHYKPVAGRVNRKSTKGKRKTEYELAVQLEYELVDVIHYWNKSVGLDIVAFRSPASKTPVDVYSILEQSQFGNNLSRVRCYQCKATRDTSPPKIIKKEFDEFVAFVNKINAEGFWVDRWKKDKGTYIRRIRGVHRDGSFWSTVEADFSDVLKEARK